jgi:hypothetical protein
MPWLPTGGDTHKIKRGISAKRMIRTQPVPPRRYHFDRMYRNWFHRPSAPILKNQSRQFWPPSPIPSAWVPYPGVASTPWGVQVLVRDDVLRVARAFASNLSFALAVRIQINNFAI